MREKGFKGAAEEIVPVECGKNNGDCRAQGLSRCRDVVIEVARIGLIDN